MVVASSLFFAFLGLFGVLVHLTHVAKEVPTFVVLGSALSPLRLPSESGAPRHSGYHCCMPSY